MPHNTPIEILQTLDYLESQGFEAQYDHRKMRISGGITIELTPNLKGYTHPFRISSVEGRWTSTIRIGQIPFDIPMPSLETAAKLVVKSYQASTTFDDSFISLNQALEKLIACGFNAYYEKNTIVAKESPLSIVWIVKRGRYFFVVDSFERRKILMVGDTLRESVDFLCAELSNPKQS